MSRTVYFVGSEPDCVAGSYSLSTTGVDTNYVRTGIKTGLGETATITLASPAPANSTEGFWVHVRKYQDNTDDYNNDDPIIIYDENNNISAQMMPAGERGTIKVRVYANNGTYADSAASLVFFYPTIANLILTHTYVRCRPWQAKRSPVIAGRGRRRGRLAYRGGGAVPKPRRPEARASDRPSCSAPSGDGDVQPPLGGVW